MQNTLSDMHRPKIHLENCLGFFFGMYNILRKTILRGKGGFDLELFFNVPMFDIW